MNSSEQMTATPSLFRKLALSFGFIIISIVYAVLQRSGTTGTLTTAPSLTPSGTLTPSQSYQAANEALLTTLSQISGSSATAPSTATTPTPASGGTQKATTPAPTTKSAGKYADGSYTGSAVDAYYGTVQVKAVVKNGQLADVQFLQYPNNRSNSRYINNQAMPLLTQEAIQAQSAQVDGVSGATFTSEAFVKSLAVALTSAKI
jgi:uncharacterized protein with FMN-binding domain